MIQRPCCHAHTHEAGGTAMIITRRHTALRTVAASSSNTSARALVWPSRGSSGHLRGTRVAGSLANAAEFALNAIRFGSTQALIVVVSLNLVLAFLLSCAPVRAADVAF